MAVKHAAIDKRTVRTKLMLSDALLFLLQNKKVSEITVHELCQKAGINRGTFYKYYKNVQDILSVTENELFVQYEKLFSEVTAMSNPDIFIYECLKLVKENGQTCRLLLAAEKYDFIRKIHYLVHNSTINYWHTRFNCDNEQLLEKIYVFVSSGVFGLIEKWVRNDFDASPFELANVINNMSDSCVNTFVGE